MASTFVPPELEKINGVYHVKGRPRETVELLGHYRPSNIPGKSIIVLKVGMDPKAASPPHTHSGAAIVAFPLQGAIMNQMNSNEPATVKKGDHWFEYPGCHHQRSENVGEEGEKAEFIAVFVIDDEVVKDGYEKLVVLDVEKEEAAKAVQ